MIERNENFPQNTEIGLSYLEHSIKSGSFEAAIYDSRLLIKSDMIPQDFEKAHKILKETIRNLLNTSNGSILFLEGKIKKKEGNHSKYFKYFEKSSKLSNRESMYEIVKMYLKGVGCQKDEEKAKYYFEMAKKKKGITKSDKYLLQNKSDNISSADKDTAVATKTASQHKNKRDLFEQYKRESEATSILEIGENGN